MNARLFDQWVETNRAILAPVVRWQEITADAAQKAAQQSLELAQEYVEFGARNAQLLGEVKDAKDAPKWAAEQGKLASEFGLKLVSRAADSFKLAKDTQEALGQVAEAAAKTVADAFVAKPA